MKSLKNGLFNADAINAEVASNVKGGAAAIKTVVYTWHINHWDYDGTYEDTIGPAPVEPVVA
jgi:hypothetical protein